VVLYSHVALQLVEEVVTNIERVVSMRDMQRYWWALGRSVGALLAHCWHTAELAGELVGEVLFLYNWKANASNLLYGVSSLRCLVSANHDAHQKSLTQTQCRHPSLIQYTL
jgi:hypothetical protein